MMIAQICTSRRNVLIQKKIKIGGINGKLLLSIKILGTSTLYACNFFCQIISCSKLYELCSGLSDHG